MTADSLQAEQPSDDSLEMVDVDTGRAWRHGACEQHGPYRSLRLYGEHWTQCQPCQDALREQQERERKEQERAWQCQERIAESGLRGRFSDATFASYVAHGAKQRAVLEACRSYVQQLNVREWKPLLLLGAVGTGKTHLGAAMVRACIESQNTAARLATAREIVRDIRSTWRRDAIKSEEEAIASWQQVSLLVVDEVGVGFGTESEAMQLLEIIDGRYVARRPTVLLSNLVVPELQALLGERAFDRIRENATVLVCDWPSYRGKRTDAPVCGTGSRTIAGKSPAAENEGPAGARQTTLLSPTPDK